MTDGPIKVGELRPSQIVWAFGPGSIIDLPNFSVIVMGLDDWSDSDCRELTEERLLAAVQARLGHGVHRLIAPPVPPIGDASAMSSSDDDAIGVPVMAFPRWYRCPRCGLLAELESGLFRMKVNKWRADLTRYVHEGCPKASNPRRPPTAIPARFVVACENGHLDDFPWRYYVHGGPTACKGQLRFYEVGASLETANLWVECTECVGPEGKPRRRSLIEAFGESARKSLPACRCRHPHLRQSGGTCDQPLRAVLLGASNTWFPETVSALYVPSSKGRLAQLVEQLWQTLEHVESSTELGFLRKTPHLRPLGKFDDDEIMAAILARRGGSAGSKKAGGDGDGDLKRPEWEVLSRLDARLNCDDFWLEATTPPREFARKISGVVLAERLREVNALVGFTRIQPPGEVSVDESVVARAPLATPSGLSMVPANEVRGEGVFLTFDLEALDAWAQLSEVEARDHQLLSAHRKWRAARRLQPDDTKYPGVAHVLLHSFAHALMRELALECGYTQASVRERIYASGYGHPLDMAGVLIYTAAPDSEGTLGGLVALGRPENLSRLVAQALEHVALCASDPLCSEHDPTRDTSLHGAACHACLFAPETSCEMGNRFLDRSLLVSTIRGGGLGFFGA
jgi:hypothetical protein